MGWVPEAHRTVCVSVPRQDPAPVSKNNDFCLDPQKSVWWKANDQRARLDLLGHRLWVVGAPLNSAGHQLKPESVVLLGASRSGERR